MYTFEHFDGACSSGRLVDVGSLSLSVPTVAFNILSRAIPAEIRLLTSTAEHGMNSVLGA